MQMINGAGVSCKLTTLWLPERLHQELKAAAATTGRPMRAAIEVGLLLFLLEKGRVQPTLLGAQAVGASDDAAAIFGRICKGESW